MQAGRPQAELTGARRDADIAKFPWIRHADPPWRRQGARHSRLLAHRTRR